MRCNLPPRYYGSRYHLIAPDRSRIILFSKGCPNPSCPIYVVVAAVPTSGRAGGWRPPPCRRAVSDRHLWAPPCSLPPCERDAAGDYHPYGLVAARRAHKRRPLRAGLGRGLAVGGRPCMGADHSWPPLLLAAFTAKRGKNA
ncbi:hypothetical protein GW17_00062502 [Ensete ventricosum]|nr:hypothetical protein GW17_00062502 [Ensete ventricosum]